MPSLGPMEILVILVVALVVLGPARLPEAGRQVGRAMTEFRRWSTGVQTELRSALEDTTPPTIEPKPNVLGQRRSGPLNRRATPPIPPPPPEARYGHLAEAGRVVVIRTTGR